MRIINDNNQQPTTNNQQPAVNNLAGGLPSTTFTDYSRRATGGETGNTVRQKQRRNGSKSGAGFTMVETLIAIAVLLLALVGPLTIAAQGLITARFAKDQIVAFYLAQEAVELIRNQRDQNALANADWDNGLGTCFTTNGCQVDATDKDFSQCPAQGCDTLYKHNDSGFYSYDTGVGYSSTRFTRIINMQEISETEMRAEISITWNNGPISKSFTIQEHFLDWQ